MNLTSSIEYTPVDSPPLVTIICTCFNNGRYVEQALLSVIQQTYKNIELIVVDNASEDDSVIQIEAFLINHPHIRFIKNQKNLGICKAFNAAAMNASGKYLIDLAADDILILDRIEHQVTHFETLNEEYGIVYSNVEEVDVEEKHLRYSLKLSESPPQGNVFEQLLKHHFIPSPSTIFKKSVFDQVGGYNEDLAYEDFDFWLKCARYYKFSYLPILSTKKRVLTNSLSSKFYSTHSTLMLDSTLKIFRWAENHLHNQRELKAWQIGLHYYLRQAVYLGHFPLAEEYYDLLKSVPLNARALLTHILFKNRVNISKYYLLYLHLRFKIKSP